MPGLSNATTYEAGYVLDRPRIRFERNPNAPPLDAKFSAPANADAVKLLLNKLPSGSQPLPPFAVLDECEFYDEKRKVWVRMDEGRLRKLADNLNQKFWRYGDAVPIIPGHTVEGVSEDKQPRRVGYGVNARVTDFISPVTGQPIRNERTGKNVKAIYIDPIALPGEVKTFHDLNRRSPELWLGPDDIDPIGLLGANTPRRNLGPHLFSRAAERGPVRMSAPVNHPTDNEGDSMPTDNLPPDSASQGGDTPPPAAPASGDGEREYSDDELVKFEKMFEQSSLGKRLEAGLSSLESFLPQIETLLGGAGGIPGAPGADMGAGAPPAGPGAPPPPMPGADMGAGAPPPGMGGGEENFDDLFAPGPTRGAGEEPEKMAAACGPMNTSLPGYEPHQFARRSPVDDVTKFSALEREIAMLKEQNASKDQRIAALEGVNLAQTVKGELEQLQPLVKFNFSRELERCVKMSRPEDRKAHYEDMKANYQPAELPLPNGGQMPIGGDQLAPSGGPVKMSRKDDLQGLSPSEVAQAAVKRIAKGESVTIDSVVNDIQAARNGNGAVKVR